MNEAPRLLLRKDPPLGWSVFNHPEKHNAVSRDMWQLLPDYTQELSEDDEIRVVILRGAGDSSFSAGADISQFTGLRRNVDEERTYTRLLERGHSGLENLEKPVLAMIHGHCIGGGVSLATACDLRLAADEALFGIPAARLGLGYPHWDVERLVRVVGPSCAKELLLTARTDFTAADALRMGLVNWVGPKVELEAVTRSHAFRIAENAPLTLRAAKVSIARAQEAGSANGRIAIDRLIENCFNSSDFEEGVRAFSEKRKPRFRGR